MIILTKYPDQIRDWFENTCCDESSIEVHEPLYRVQSCLRGSEWKAVYLKLNDDDRFLFDITFAGMFTDRSTD